MADNIYFVTEYKDALGIHYNIGTGDVQIGHVVLFSDLTYAEAAVKVEELTAALRGYFISKKKNESGKIFYSALPLTQVAEVTGFGGEIVETGLTVEQAVRKAEQLNTQAKEYNDSLNAAPEPAEIDAKIAETLLKREKEKKLGYWEDYYAGADVGVFIGGLWVDDIITIQHTLTNNKSPIYGYMSEKFDAVTRGTTIVQGQFAIAFKETGYLTTILENYKKENAGNITTIEETLEAQAGTAELAFTKAEQGTPPRVDKWGYLDTKYGNIISKGFDIIITYGDINEQFRGGTIEKLNEVHITSISKVCEPTGDPIAEMYSFFARTSNEDLPSRIFGKKNEIEEVQTRIRHVAQQTPAENAADALRLENDRKALSEKDVKRKTSWEKTMEAIREAED